MKTTPIFEGKAARLLTRLEYEGSVVEFEHETALAEVTKFKAWGMSGPGCKITVVEVSEVPGLERPRLPGTVLNSQSVGRRRVRRVAPRVVW